MRILKGVLLGMWLFGFGTMAFLYFAIYRYMQPHSAVDINLLTGHTSQNPFWWTALVICLVLGCAITRSWSVPLGLWIALLVTGLFPAGFFALSIVAVVMLKAASHGHS